MLGDGLARDVLGGAGVHLRVMQFISWVEGFVQDVHLRIRPRF
jgi:hypothetical protein